MTIEQARDEAAWTVAWTDALTEPGKRTNYARASARKTLAAIDAVIAGETPEPVPPDAAPFGLPLVFAPTKLSDWKEILHERYSGAITNPQPGRFHVHIDGPADLDGGRMEMHEMDWPGGGLPIGAEGYYEWLIRVPSGIRFHPRPEGNTCHQAHGDEKSHYTGGTTIVSPNGEAGEEWFAIRVSGGTWKGGNEYSYMSGPVRLGALQRGRFHRIGWHVRWSAKPDGFVHGYLDGKLGVRLDGIPSASELADTQMFRLGAYPREVYAGGLDLDYDEVRVYGRAS
jgi:hypothetical protein